MQICCLTVSSQKEGGVSLRTTKGEIPMDVLVFREGLSKSTDLTELLMLIREG